MRYDAVIFDMDGVICYTDKYHTLAWKELTERLGLPFDETAGDRIRGVSRMESLAIVLGEHADAFSDLEKARFAEEKNERYRGLLHRMSPADLSDEVRVTLERLRAMGLKLAIGSSSKNALLILERIGLGGWFDAVSDGNNISRSKPDPQVFLMAAEMLGAAPERCLVVEDAQAGLDAAHAGGMHCAALSDATRCGRAEYNLESISDLVGILEQEVQR